LILGACEQAGTDAKQAGDKAAAAVEATVDKAKEAKEKVSNTTAAAVQTTVDKAKEAKEKVAVATTDVAAAAVEKAKELIQKVKDFLAKNQLDSAEEIMAQLHKLVDSLPDELKAQIESLKQKIASMRGGTATSAAPAATPPSR
jgi:predicted metal-dependent hydrolase